MLESNALIELNFITVMLYAAAALSVWVLVRRDSTPPAWPAVLLWLAVIAHALVLGQTFFADGKPGINMGFSHVLSLIVWLTVVSYISLGRDARLMRLAARWLAPVAALAVLLMLWLPGMRVMEYDTITPALTAHIIVGVLAYALYTVAALHALLILFLQRQLHAGDVPTLPPLLRMEALMFQLLWIGFALLSITLLSGSVFSEALFGKPFQVNHKTVFSAMSWLIFGGVLLAHWRAGLRGRIAVRWVLIGFAMLLLSYVGSRFVLEIILKRVS